MCRGRQDPYEVLTRPQAAYSTSGDIRHFPRMDTHSPILVGIQGADIWQSDDHGMSPGAWEDLDVVRLHRRYLEWRANR